MPGVTKASASPEFDPNPPADDYVLNPESKTAPTPSSADAVAIAPPKTRLFRAPTPTKSKAAESIAATGPSETELVGKIDSSGASSKRPAEPSSADTEGYRPTANRPTYLSAAKPSVDSELSSGDRPHRLGAASGPIEPTIAGSWSREKAERGVNPGPVTMNPFASRPTVELAERPSESSDGVIYQPNSSSTKR